MKVTVTAADSSVIVENEKARAADADWASRSFLVRNETGSATVYLETDAAATVASGFPWKATDAPLEITLEPGQALHAIVASGGTDQELRVLRSGR